MTAPTTAPTPEQQDQIRALAMAMSTIPGLDPTKGRTPVNAAVRRVWAAELVTKWGVSIDPEKASVEAVNTTPGLGNHGAHEVRDRKPVTMPESEQARQFMRASAPDFLAANSPDLAARIAAAKTPEQRDALAAELKEKILNDPNTLVTDFLGLLKGLDQT